MPRFTLKHRLLLSILLIVSAILYSGLRIQSTGHATGTSLHGRPSFQIPLDSLRIATFNIHRARGTDKKENLDRVADVLRPFDLIGLNEVGPEQAEELGEELNRQYLYLPSERQWWRDSFGNAFLSTIPTQRWRRIPIAPAEKGGLRNINILRLPWRNTILNIVQTHTDLKPGGDAQLQKAIDLFLAQPTPAILMGDLNAKRAHPLIQKLLSTPGVIEPFDATQSKNDTEGRIDWIFLRGLTPTQAGWIDNGASDHPMVWAEVRLP